MRRQLRTDAVRGAGWAFFSSWSVRVVQMVTTLTLAKLLMPADFGVFALASIILNALIVFRDVGFAQILIYQQKDITGSANTAFVMSLVSGAILSVLLFASAPLIGRFFNIPDIVPPIQWMSPTLLISGAANVPMALLDKNLKFKRRAVPELSSAVVYAAVSISLAALGFGSWSLVTGWIAMTAASTTAAWVVSGWRPSLEFDRTEAGVILSYGKHLMIASLLAFVFFQIDKAAVGMWLGVTATGFYSMAFTVCNMPATNLSHVVNRVMFPTYSRIQDDLSDMGKVYLRTMKYIAMLAFPAAAGIFVISGPVTQVFYGDKWLPAIPLFHILAVYGLIRSIGSTPSAVFMSTGHPKLVRHVSALQLLIAGSLMYPAAIRYGTVGVAVVFTGAYLIGTIYAIAQVQRILGIEALGCLNVVRTPLSAACIAAFAAWLPTMAQSEATYGGIILAALLVTGLYIAIVLGFDRSSYQEIRMLLAESKQTRIVSI